MKIKQLKNIIKNDSLEIFCQDKKTDNLPVKVIDIRIEDDKLIFITDKSGY